MIPPPLPTDPKTPTTMKTAWQQWRRGEVDVRFCILINLFAFPGLGTFLARRRGGLLQSILMVTGFCLVSFFMGAYFMELLRMLRSANPDQGLNLSQVAWMGWWGGGLCVFAWIWAAISSFQMRPRSKVGSRS